VKLIRPVAITGTKLVSSNVPEEDYAAWDALVTYVTGDRVIYVTTDVHKVYESVADANLGENPYDSTTVPAKWAEVGATNRWRLFDNVVSSQTTNNGSIDVTIYPVEPVNALALVNVAALTAAVTMMDFGGTTVYSETFSLQDSSGITDWYDFFTEPPRLKSDFAVTDLPPYANATVRVVLESSGIAACGELVVGLYRLLGGTRWGANVGIQDYSIKQRNTWGDYEIVERAYNKRAEFSLILDSTDVDMVQSTLAAYRATPMVYLGAENYGATIIYGFYKDFAVDIAYPLISYCSITIEGLV
jgi:hypothetical protein